MRRAALALALLAACQGSPSAPPTAPTAEPTAASATASASVAASAAASAAPRADLFAPKELMAHVEALTTAKMAGREAGSEGERLAAGYIAGVLRAAGIAPSDQPVDMADGRKSLNVVGVIRGAGERAGEHVVLGAHMDHLGTRPEGVYHGAEDNASGVAVVLEIGEALQRQRALLGRSVVLVFFGAEEVGLWGSRAFAQKPTVSPLAAMVNVDMIGREFIDQSRFAAVKPIFGIHSREGIGILGTKGRPHLRAIVDAACAKEGLTAWAPEDLPQAVAEWVERQTRGRGDNHSFEEVGVPALFYGSGESDDYHQPSDTPEKLDPLLMQVRARAILHTVVALTTADLASPR